MGTGILVLTNTQVTWMQVVLDNTLRNSVLWNGENSIWTIVVPSRNLDSSPIPGLASLQNAAMKWLWDIITSSISFLDI